jgi:hypothetical protein
MLDESLCVAQGRGSAQLVTQAHVGLLSENDLAAIASELTSLLKTQPHSIMVGSHCCEELCKRCPEVCNCIYLAKITIPGLVKDGKLPGIRCCNGQFSKFSGKPLKGATEMLWLCTGFKVGDKVEARYREKSPAWKPATVVSVHDSGIMVLFDGSSDADVVPDHPSRIRAKIQPVDAQPPVEEELRWALQTAAGDPLEVTLPSDGSVQLVTQAHVGLLSESDLADIGSELTNILKTQPHHQMLWILCRDELYKRRPEVSARIKAANVGILRLAKDGKLPGIRLRYGPEPGVKKFELFTDSLEGSGLAQHLTQAHVGFLAEQWEDVKYERDLVTIGKELAKLLKTQPHSLMVVTNCCNVLSKSKRKLCKRLKLAKVTIPGLVKDGKVPGIRLRYGLKPEMNMFELFMGFKVGDKVEARYREESDFRSSPSSPSLWRAPALPTSGINWKTPPLFVSATVVSVDDSGITVLFDGSTDADVVPDHPSRIRAREAPVAPEFRHLGST